MTEARLCPLWTYLARMRDETAEDVFCLGKRCGLAKVCGRAHDKPQAERKPFKEHPRLNEIIKWWNEKVGNAGVRIKDPSKEDRERWSRYLYARLKEDAWQDLAKLARGIKNERSWRSTPPVLDSYLTSGASAAKAVGAAGVAGRKPKYDG